MDPGRRAMLANKGSSSHRDVTAPRADANTRVTKATRPDAHAKTAQNAARYLSSDEQSRQFVADEDKFVLKQSKKKADIRVREGRAKPVDHLAFSLRYLDPDRDVFDDNDGDLDIELKAPATVVEALGTAAQLTELDSDIGSYLALETDATNKQYWGALRTLCEDQKSKLDPLGRDDRALRVVADNIDKILSSKTYEQLDALENHIKAKLRGSELIDTDYWEQLMREVLVRKAKARLERIFQTASEAREKLLKDGGDRKPSQTSVRNSKAPSSVATADSTAAPAGNEDVSQATKALYDREAARGILDNEEIFTAEEAVPSGAKPQWAAQHRARKPRYFNRVQMGYEWNKYNQTHYDHEAPPPKVVQGYKFNIFYPDLIDTMKTPTYKIIRENGRKRGESFAAAGEEDTCLIRFIAGPPYEDIAFRIVDREWDYSAKKERGFKSSFDKGILQLHFQFKKIFYRK
ncbi:Uncharacterized protein TPAR_06630 [Tolypocladium paradoxum]|uniref:Splicing factor Cactin n=1 Tax=Tolypocladium paradoxum TaxID=94208 RepID=A0A2S4KSK8_9HYPO|nr:Uncharacterized protein TPAR_06630 [Tolypocladium paradoxum]